MAKFQYYFAQQEAVETIVFLYDVVKAKDKYDLIRFDSSWAVSANMFDEVNITRKTGNIFLTNIHRVYSGNDVEPSTDDEATMDYFLGKEQYSTGTDTGKGLA